MNLRLIHMVGVEVEGFWNDGNLPDATPGRIVSDGSLSASGLDGAGTLQGREFISSPTSNMEALSAWMTRIWPAFVNQTCGLHVHMSFKNNMDYGRLIDRRFYDYFIKELEAWGHRALIKNKHFLPRLRGECSFCKKEFNPDVQMALTAKGPGRFTQLNYCYNFHKTLECRVLPTFKMAHVGVRAVGQVVRITEDYLANSACQTVLTTKITASDAFMPQPIIDLLTS